MRRSIIAAAAALCLLLSGCASSTVEAKDIDFQFDCKVDVTYSDGSATCSFQRFGPKNAELEVISDDSKGLTWDWNGDGFTVTYQGLAASSENCVLPQNSFAAVLVNTLDQAEQSGALTSLNGNEFSGNAGYDFTLTANPDTGEILTLSVPDCKIKAQFYDYAQKTMEADVVLDPEPD